MAWPVAVVYMLDRIGSFLFYSLAFCLDFFFASLLFEITIIIYKSTLLVCFTYLWLSI